MNIYKLKAGSLQFAILISAIIAVLLAVFVILANAHTLFGKKSDLVIEMMQQADNTIRYSLQDFTIARDSSFLTIDEEKDMKSTYHRSYWGMYGKVFVESKAKSQIFEKIALVSGWQTIPNRTGLYLKDTNRPFILVGNTKIEGKSFLPKRGVRAGNISGNSYYGSQLIYGNQFKSTENLPQLPKKLIAYIQTLQKQPLPLTDKDFLDIHNTRKHINSFKNPTKIIYAKGELDLVNIKLTGNIIIRSDTKIMVAASSSLKDVILVAPKVIIEANTKGNFQVIANKNITVGKNCNLLYPSALVIKTENDVETNLEEENKKKIFIDESTTIKGMICYLQDKTTNTFEPQVIFANNTHIYGFVYCEQQAELLGTIYGSMYTSGFITKQFGSIYQNHIYNGTISSSELIEEYVGFPFDNLEYKVAKWLY